MMNRYLTPIVILVAVFIAGGANAASVELPNFSELVEHNGKSVVNISTTQSVTRPAFPKGFDLPDLPENSPFHEFFKRFLEDMPESYDVRSLGSGFIISKDGYILTCAHVIDKATEIIVRLTDRREFEAKVVGKDRRSDVALLKIEATDLPTVEIGNPSSLKVGEWVLAIGSPFGFDSTATAGIVSAKGRSLPQESYVPFIQTDVAINPGNSGGPLFDLDGKVVGINAQIYSRTGGFMGLSFAVPIDLAIQVAEQIKKHGRVSRGWLGVTIQNVTRELAESFNMKKPYGALVADIMSDSPASKSDLQVGDVIISYNKHRISSSSDLPPHVGRTPVGEEAVLGVIRNGRKKDITVKIGELPEDDRDVMQTRSESKQDESVFGMVLQDLGADELKERGIDHGVLVAEVKQGAAQKADIRANDIILRVARKPALKAEQVQEQLARLKKGHTVPILVRRGNNSLFVVLKAPLD